MGLATGKFIGTNRFLIQRRLGSGGFGIVFQAYDIQQDEIVALKILQQWNGEALFELKKEFRSLANINHPNLVTLYELFSEESEWFFTMELVVGKPFLDYIKQDPSILVSQGEISVAATIKTDIKNLTNFSDTLKTDPTTYTYKQNSFLPNITNLRLAMHQLVLGIDALHQANKLHCDIKPPNVLVTNQGQVKILDFGLVREQTNNNQHLEDKIAGTPAYMSPEQGLGKELSEATDWYSVGIMLYQALTGVLPFSGSLREILMDKIRGQFPLPNLIIPELPKDLCDLCLDLMKHNPEKRPSAKEILTRLAAPNLEQKIESKTLDNFFVTAPAQEIPFIGRQLELKLLEEAFLKVKNRNTALMVFVHGSSGQGKSTLVRHFLDELQISEPNLLVLSGRCYQQESIPYKTFDSIIDGLSQHLKHLSSTVNLPNPPGIIALTRLFPVLQQVDELQNKNSSITPSSQELRRRAFTALRELISWLAKQSPLILYIDDLQWGDIDSVGLMAEILSPPNPPPILLIATYRTEETESSPLLRKLLPLAQIGKLSEVQKIEVKEFDLEQAQQLVVSLLNKKLLAAFSKNQLPIENIIKDSNGSPFFIIELARFLQNSEASADDIHTFATNTLDQALKQRIFQLPDAAKELLEIVAVAGQPIKLDIIKKLLKEKLKKHGSLLLLRTNYLIRVRETQNQEEIETYHDRIRETILGYLEKQTLKDYHLNLALTLEKDSETDPERLMRHFHQAENYQSAYNYALTAASNASQALAFDQAAEVYQFILELIDNKQINVNSNELHKLRIKLGDSLTNAGRGKQAALAYLLAADNATNQEEVVELKRRAAEELLISGHIKEGSILLNTILKLLGMKLAKTRKHAFISLLYQRLKLKLRGLTFKQRKESEISSLDLLKIDTCWSVSLGLSMVDTMRGADFQVHQLLLALKAGEPFRISRALAFEATYCATAGKTSYQESKQILQVARNLAEETANPYAISLSFFLGAVIEFLNGNWQQAYELDLKAEKFLRDNCTGVQWELDGVNVNMLHNLLFLGKLQEAAERLPVLLNEAQRRGDIYAKSILSYRISYFLHLVVDEPEKAIEELTEVAQFWISKEFYQQHFYILLAKIETELYQGNAQRAWDFILKYQTTIKTSFIINPQILRVFWFFAFARTALAMFAKTNDKSFLKLAEQKAKALQKEQVAWSSAFGLSIEASVMYYQKNLDKAVELLKKAEEVFLSANMQLYAIAARRQCGTLLENETGKEMIKTAGDYLLSQQVKCHGKFIQLLIPIKSKK
ncbi:MAG: protein kinase [Blastocatellia bacterium]